MHPLAFSKDSEQLARMRGVDFWLCVTQIIPSACLARLFSIAPASDLVRQTSITRQVRRRLSQRLLYVCTDERCLAVNINSHLFGGLLFCWLLATVRRNYLAQYATTTWSDGAVFAIFLASAVICLFASASYHTFGVHSKGVCATRPQLVDTRGTKMRFRSLKDAMPSITRGSSVSGISYLRNHIR